MSGLTRGTDTLDLTLVTEALTIEVIGQGNVEITNSDATNKVTAGSNVEYVKAGKDTNTLNLSALGEKLTVTIKKDNDVIVAKTDDPYTEIIRVNEAGNDILIGGADNDTLEGGLGHD